MACKEGMTSQVVEGMEELQVASASPYLEAWEAWTSGNQEEPYQVVWLSVSRD